MDLFSKNESIRPEFSAKGLAVANEQLAILKLDDKQRREYESWEMELHQRASMVKSHYGRGHREGREEGNMSLQELGETQSRYFRWAISKTFCLDLAKSAKA